MALALAANMAGGYNEWAGTGGSEMFFHNGLAARSAVTAVQLAAQGAYASRTALDGDAGMLAAFRRPRPPTVPELFADRPEILAVFFKPVPACNFAQTPAQAALALAQRHRLRAADIDSVVVRVTKAAALYPGCDASGPFEQILQAKMSIHYNVAAALAHGNFAERNYVPQQNPEVQALAKRVTRRDRRRLHERVSGEARRGRHRAHAHRANVRAEHGQRRADGRGRRARAVLRGGQRAARRRSRAHARPAHRHARIVRRRARARPPRLQCPEHNVMNETTHNGSAPRESVRRVALASMVGTSIEWYDFFIFGTASALVFGRLFFPTFSELAGTLAAFASFAVGFVARPRRRPRVRPLRRPHRAEDHARRHVDDDGPGHLRDGVDAELRDDRRVGADPDGRAALRARPRRRRRVGRRGAHGHGALGRPAPRLLRQLRARWAAPSAG